jgi:hypothetical protein
MDVTPFAKLLIITGLALVVIGALLLALSKISPLGLGRLPGDITIKRDHFTLHLPIVTCLLISAAGTIILWIVSRLLKK